MPSPKPAQPAARPSRTVIVASKLPMGLQLQLCEMRDEKRQFQGTTWIDRVAARVGPIVHVRGTAYPRGQAPEGFKDPPEMVAGFALTRGIDAEWWDKWEEQNESFPPVDSGILFAAETMDEIRQRARKEFGGIVSGLDPIKPPKENQTEAERDPRLPKLMRGLTISGEPGPTDADAA